MKNLDFVKHVLGCCDVPTAERAMAPDQMSRIEF